MDYAANVLIVSAGEKSRNTLSDLLKMDGFLTLTTVKSGSQARRLLLSCGYDLVIVNTPLPDEFGDEIVAAFAEEGSGAILLVQSDVAEEVSEKLADCGAFVIEKPINRLLFFQAVKLVWTARKRELGIKNENCRLREKIDEIRLVDRAKCVLIQVLGMTEPQAHRYIEKQAMDLRKPRGEIARNILKTYEN